MSNYDRKQIHRIRTGDSTDRLAYTPLEGELIESVDGASPKLYCGDGTTAGGFLVGPLGGFFGIEKLNSDLGPITAIPWTATPSKTEDFDHSTSTNPSEVGFNEGGLYSIRCHCTVAFAATTYFVLQIQRDQSAGVWKNINGGGSFVSGVAGDYRNIAVSCQYVFPLTEKVRVVGSNGLLTTTNTLLVANYCSFELTRIR